MQATAEKLSNEAILVLRNCRLLETSDFVRCGRRLGLDTAARIAKEIRAATGDAEDQVFHAYNAETGHEDYVRVNAGTEAFRLICQMKS